MPDFYSEPFLTLAGLTHKSALISWGAFYFRVKDSGKEFKLVDDDDLKHIHPPREDSIGAKSKPYGDAKVEVMNLAGSVVATALTSQTNHCWVSGLAPDTEYTYRVTVNNEEWAQGPRRNWEKVDGKMGLGPKTKGYQNRFRTYPDPTKPADGPFTFAVIGDFGIGIKKDEKDRRQRQIAEALEKAVNDHNVRLILTTGDNIYRSGGFLGMGGETGNEDDDWYFTYYQPYRYVINRVPAYPTIGNHDADETEDKDDRTQLVDNFYINERIAGEEAAGRASVDPGLFYRFRFSSDVEFICIDTSKEPTVFDKKKRLYEHPKHQEFLKTALPKANGGASPSWLIPFCHHPPFCAGPKHHNTEKMENLIKQFEEAGVRVVLSGHEHQFQHSRSNNINYFVTGGAGKIRSDTPDEFAKARTVSWAAAYHFLLVTVDGKQMTIRPIGELSGGQLSDIQRLAPDETGTAVTDPIIIKLA